jgi:hypothetical protein
MLEGYDPRFQILTPQMMHHLSDDELLDAVYHHAVLRMGEDTFPDTELVESLSEGVRVAWSVIEYALVMENCGLALLLEPGEPSTQHMLEGLRYVGAMEHAALVSDAIDVATRNLVVLTPLQVEKEFDGVHPTIFTKGIFNGLDARYWGLPNVRPILIRVIRDNPERFCSS